MKTCSADKKAGSETGLFGLRMLFNNFYNRITVEQIINEVIAISNDAITVMLVDVGYGCRQGNGNFNRTLAIFRAIDMLDGHTTLALVSGTGNSKTAY